MRKKEPGKEPSPIPPSEKPEPIITPPEEKPGFPLIPFPEKPAEPKEVKVLFTSEPSGAVIYINGKKIDPIFNRTPVKHRMKQGSYEIKMERERHLPFTQT